LLSELWMHYTPLTWYEQEDLRHRAHIESLPRELCFTSPCVEGYFSNIVLSVLQVGIPIHKAHISSLLKVK